MIRLAVLLVVVAVVAAIWKHLSYTQQRRNRVHDLQPAFYSGETFHVLRFLKLAPGADLFTAVRSLRVAEEAGGRALMVYAGKAVASPLVSAQLAERFGPNMEWDAVVLTQFASREDFESSRTSNPLRLAMAPFSQSYSHGMKRPAALNLLIPPLLMGIRWRQVLTRAPSMLPFEPAPLEEFGDDWQAVRQKLLAERELGREAVLIANLIKDGTPEQMAADRRYGGKMFALMAEVGNGPMHAGKAVTLELDTSFDKVALVYYPGVQYSHDMFFSRLFSRILGDKQLADSQATITVPILHLL